jgi:hypothetical protein
MTLSICWPMTLPSMSNERLNRFSKAKLVKAQRATTDLALRAHYVGTRLEPLGHGMQLVVRLVRCHTPRSRIRDEHDNLRTAFKHVVDAIAAYFGIDDSDKRVRWEYAQEPAHESSVRVEFTMQARNTDGDATGGAAHRSSEVGPEVNHQMRGDQAPLTPGTSPGRPRAVLPAESLQQRVRRLATPAYVANDDEPKGAA